MSGLHMFLTLVVAVCAIQVFSLACEDKKDDADGNVTPTSTTSTSTTSTSTTSTSTTSTSTISAPQNETSRYNLLLLAICDHVRYTNPPIFLRLS